MLQLSPGPFSWNTRPQQSHQSLFSRPWDILLSELYINLAKTLEWYLYNINVFSSRGQQKCVNISWHNLENANERQKFGHPHPELLIFQTSTWSCCPLRSVSWCSITPAGKSCWWKQHKTVLCYSLYIHQLFQTCILLPQLLRKKRSIHLIYSFLSNGDDDSDCWSKSDPCNIWLIICGGCNRLVCAHLDFFSSLEPKWVFSSECVTSSLKAQTHSPTHPTNPPPCWSIRAPPPASHTASGQSSDM